MYYIFIDHIKSLCFNGIWDMLYKCLKLCGKKNLPGTGCLFIYLLIGSNGWTWTWCSLSKGSPTELQEHPCSNPLACSAHYSLQDRLHTYSEGLCRQLLRNHVSIQLFSRFRLKLLRCYIFHHRRSFYFPIWQMSHLTHLANSKTDLKKDNKCNYIDGDELQSFKKKAWGWNNSFS